MAELGCPTLEDLLDDTRLKKMTKAFLACCQVADAKGLSDGLESQRHSVELLKDTYQRPNENPCWLTKARQ